MRTWFTTALAKLIIAIAIGAAAWWVASDRGWVPGKPNAPRPENFARAIDTYLAHSGGSRAPCIPAQVAPPPDGIGFPDIRFEWTPASFRVEIDERTAQRPDAARRMAFFAAQGFFVAKPLESGAIEYTLTWAGYVASSNRGCFELASGARSATVLSYSLSRTEKDIEIYEVIARPHYTEVEPWVNTQAFQDAFVEERYLAALESAPIAYQLARGGEGFTVVAERGRPVPVIAQGVGIAALLAEPTVDEAQLRAALADYLAGTGAARARVCLDLPQRHEVHETNLRSGRRARGAQDPIQFTFYNLLSTRGRSQDNALRGYVLMRKLESLGHARSELLPETGFRNQPAAGAVRFTLEPAFTDGLVENRSACYPIGTLTVEAILDSGTTRGRRPRQSFIARLAFKPYDEATARLAQAFPHLARLAAVGALGRGTLVMRDGHPSVSSMSLQLPDYYPDVSDVRLPVVEAAPMPIAPSARPKT